MTMPLARPLPGHPGDARNERRSERGLPRRRARLLVLTAIVLSIVGLASSPGASAGSGPRDVGFRSPGGAIECLISDPTQPGSSLSRGAQCLTIEQPDTRGCQESDVTVARVAANWRVGRVVTFCTGGLPYCVGRACAEQSSDWRRLRVDETVAYGGFRCRAPARNTITCRNGRRAGFSVDPKGVRLLRSTPSTSSKVPSIDVTLTVGRQAVDFAGVRLTTEFGTALFGTTEAVLRAIGPWSSCTTSGKGGSLFDPVASWSSGAARGLRLSYGSLGPTNCRSTAGTAVLWLSVNATGSIVVRTEYGDVVPGSPLPDALAQMVERVQMVLPDLVQKLEEQALLGLIPVDQWIAGFGPELLEDVEVGIERRVCVGAVCREDQATAFGAAVALAGGAAVEDGHTMDIVSELPHGFGLVDDLDLVVVITCLEAEHQHAVGITLAFSDDLASVIDILAPAIASAAVSFRFKRVDGHAERLIPFLPKFRVVPAAVVGRPSRNIRALARIANAQPFG